MSVVIEPAIEVEHAFGVDDNGRSMTTAEFDEATDWDEHYIFELVRGVLIVSPPPGAGERSSNDDLAYWFRTYQRNHPNGRLLDDTLPEQTIATRENRRRADRTVWIGLGRAPQPLIEVPSIVIEIVSRSHRDRRRDYIENRDEYAEIGVKEYWVLDRYRKTLTVYCLHHPVQTLNASEVYRTELLPGFDLPLTELFNAADRYPED